jgi:hypothetical protein
MNEPYPLDHERLDVYRLAVEFGAWVGELEAKRGHRPAIHKLA